MPSTPSRTIVVLGAAYAGYRAAEVLAAGVPDDWRIVVIDKSTHFNHVYAFPRVSVLPGHEHKMFVPQTKLFPSDSRHSLVHGQVVQVARDAVTYLTPDQVTRTIAYDHLVYALGSQMPQPINVWSRSDADGTKPQGVEWMQERQVAIAAAQSVLVIGGGALGVQLASDIAAIHTSSGKSITLLHSRAHLLNRFGTFMHDQALERLRTMGVRVELGARVDKEASERGVVRTTDGRAWTADETLWCTGQLPNTKPLLSYFAPSIDPATGLILVDRTLRLDDSDRVFAAGDCVDAFGALNAGHTAYHQGEVCARNILAVIGGKHVPLEEYHPPLPAIKVTLGLDSAIREIDGKHDVCAASECHDDLDVHLMWEWRGLSCDDWTV